MPLHPIAKQLLDDAAASDRPNAHLLPVEQARANFEATFGAVPAPDVHEVFDVALDVDDGSVLVRVYKPTPLPGLPAVVYFHGGGWQMGSIDSHDGICRALAIETGAAVVSVGYRRPPEHKFPVAPRDCFAALRWLAATGAELGIDTTRIALAGDSAGGNLAAAVALLSRDEGGPRIACQALIYPATTFDLAIGFDMDFEGYVLFRDELQWHKNAYLARERDAESPYASPLNAALHDLPPTVILTAEYDPLHRQGELFAATLRSAGVPTELRQYDGMIHGFAQLPHVFDDADHALKYLADFVGFHLGTTS